MTRTFLKTARQEGFILALIEKYKLVYPSRCSANKVLDIEIHNSAHAQYDRRCEPADVSSAKECAPRQRNGKMTLTINRKQYFQLLDNLQLIPKIIETEAEYEHYLAVTAGLISKKDLRTTEETALFRLLVKLIDDYEESTFALDEWSSLPPHELLQYLLESSGTKQADLVGIISPSKGLISSIVNDKRSISKEQAKKLGTFFNVSSSLFI